jgi:hypothetical protein
MVMPDDDHSSLLEDASQRLALLSRSLPKVVEAAAVSGISQSL